MGGRSSSALPEGGPDFGPAPDDLSGLALADGFLFLFAKSALLEVRAPDALPATRIVSLAPTCACPTAAGTFLVGFANGTLSEFDRSLNLITTYIAPGGRLAHAGAVVQVASSEGCRACTVGVDRQWRFWASDGNLIRAIAASAPLDAVCCTSAVAWAADANAKMHGAALAGDAVAVFALPARARCIAAVSEQAAVAGLENGAAVLCAQGAVIAQISGTRRAIVGACVLAVNADDGAVTWVAGDEAGRVVVRVLEHEVAEIGDGLGAFAIGPDGIVVRRGGRLRAMDREALLAIAQRPREVGETRKSIADFFAPTEGEGD